VAACFYGIQHITEILRQQVCKVMSAVCKILGFSRKTGRHWRGKREDNQPQD
jgi:hypothetical protein